MSKTTDKQQRELRQLAELPDEDIDTSDIPEVSDFSGAVRGRFYRPIKQQITLRIDVDLLEWFEAQGGKYQTHINAALREYVQTHRGLSRKQS
ncbi:BrnA antitoxin family protein [Candidatus Thiosymbion oneisti]|uniref:BrnA antitoxin family protein n=1 Tax=Candidatus Thiosymbion oneisti TaxID=589554 RepID=UPI000AF94399|nr:BrnA antitoxin family protein [Candidatus Thiosymbion oneisti]